MHEQKHLSTINILFSSDYTATTLDLQRVSTFLITYKLLSYSTFTLRLDDTDFDSSRAAALLQAPDLKVESPENCLKKGEKR